MPEESIERRSFLGVATWMIGGLIGALYAIPAIIYLIAPSLQKQEEDQWLTLGSTSKVELGTPTLFKASVERQTGWITNQEELSVYVLTENGRDYAALSNICTHLACRVRWIEDQEQFFCPCHNAVFAKNGDVLEGPPPRPLDRYEVRVQDDQIQVLGG